MPWRHGRVGGSPSRDGFPFRNELGQLPVEQPCSTAQQERYEIYSSLVERACSEQPPGDIRPSPVENWPTVVVRVEILGRRIVAHAQVGRGRLDALPGWIVRRPAASLHCSSDQDDGRWRVRARIRCHGDENALSGETGDENALSGETSEGVCRGSGARI